MLPFVEILCKIFQRKSQTVEQFEVEFTAGGMIITLQACRAQVMSLHLEAFD